MFSLRFTAQRYMPGINGKALFTALSKLFPDLKVLYMSGYTDDVIIHHGILDTDVAFIQKPFKSKTILDKVRAVLDG